MIKFKVTAKKSGIKNSIRKVIGRLPKTVQKGADEASVKIADNIRSRFESYYSAAGNSKIGNISSLIRAGKSRYDGDTIHLGIGNIAELDKATEVAARSTGKVYHLWRLLEFGYGKKGGFRSDLYDIYPIMPTSSQGQYYYKRYGGTRRGGVHHSDPNRRRTPALVFYANGRLVFSQHVRHPGAEGRFFFLTVARDWYNTDKAVLIESINKAVTSMVEKYSYKEK